MTPGCRSFVVMARQAGDTRITGTIDEFCFYKMDGEYFVRKKSRLTGKRFWKDKAFEGSRRSCSRFAEGNKIASKVYQEIDEEKRVYKLFCFLKRTAIALLKNGMKGEGAEKVLIEYLVDFGIVRKEVSEDIKPAEKTMWRFDNSTILAMWKCGNERVRAIRQFDNSAMGRKGNIPESVCETREGKEIFPSPLCETREGKECGNVAMRE